MMFCKKKEKKKEEVCLGIYNVLNLFSMFLKMS